MKAFHPLQAKSESVPSPARHLQRRLFQGQSPRAENLAEGPTQLEQTARFGHSFSQIPVFSPLSSENSAGKGKDSASFWEKPLASRTSSPIQRMVINNLTRQQATAENVIQYANNHGIVIPLSFPEIQHELNEEASNPYQIDIPTFLGRIGGVSPRPSSFTPPPAKKPRVASTTSYGGSVVPTTATPLSGGVSPYVPVSSPSPGTIPATPASLTDREIEDFVEKNPPGLNESFANYLGRLRGIFVKQGGNVNQFSKIAPIALTAARIAQIAHVRQATTEMEHIVQSGELSEEEESETEVEKTEESGQQEGIKIIRVTTYRDTLKVLRRLRKLGSGSSIAVRIGAKGPVFEIQIKSGGNIYLSPIDPQEEKPGRRPQVRTASGEYVSVKTIRKLKKGDQPGEGYVAKHSTTYTNLGEILAKYPPQQIAGDIHEKFAHRTPYPDNRNYPSKVKETMDELFALLFIVEVYRTGFAGPLAFASVQAILKGEAIETVLFKGEGQSEALHVGTSQASKKPNISGQQAEQRVGSGNLRKEEFNKALLRTLKLFEKASESKSPETFANLFRTAHLALIQEQKR